MIQGNEKALFLIDKSVLSDKDKEFLEVHLKTLEYILDSLAVENSSLRDVIDSERSKFDILIEKIRNIYNKHSENEEGSKNISINEITEILREF